MSNPQKPTLTRVGCEQICGKRFGWYTDIGPRLSTWLIPVLLLTVNMEVAPLDKRRYQMLIHLLGDPIDSLWSLLTKLEAWSRCYFLTRDRNLATLVGGFEDLIGFYADPFEVFMDVIEASSLDGTLIGIHIARAAQRLADSRTDERLRTLLSTVLYIYQLVSAFVSTVGGGNTSPPGGRIGITMFMTWVIPSILLSNALGCFTSRRSCFDILDTFVRDINPVIEKDGRIRDLEPRTNLWKELQRTVPEMRRRGSVQNYFDSLCWSGGIYTYRPSKRLVFAATSGNRSPLLLLILAVSPIMISSIIASVILWHTPPIAINCRNLLVFSIVILIYISAFLTWAFSFRFQGAAHWYAVFIKDVCLAVPFVILVFLAVAGRFNSCWCWSGVYSLGARARIPMNPAADFIHFDKTTYPILVSVCLGLLILSFIVMMMVGWRGWNVMRWSEQERQEVWDRTRPALSQRRDAIDEA